MKENNTYGHGCFLVILGWIILGIILAIATSSCQSHDYIHEKDGELTKVSFDILGTDSIRSGVKITLPTLAIEIEESMLDTERIQAVVEALNVGDIGLALKLLGVGL